MALSLLRNVAEKALGGIGNAANSAFNYLQKNAPEVIDRQIQNSIFSKQNQNVVAGVGRALQKTPDTGFKAPFSPTKIFKNTPLEPIDTFNDKANEFITSLPGEFIRGYGRTSENLATPEGRKTFTGGVKQYPSQTKDLFTEGFKEAPQNALEILANPATEDILNIADLFSLGTGTAAKIAGREGVEQVAKKATKELFEQGAETAAKKGTRELIERGAGSGRKTLFHGTAGEFDIPKSMRQLMADGSSIEASNIGGRSPFVHLSDDVIQAQGYAANRAKNMGGTPSVKQFDIKEEILDFTKHPSEYTESEKQLLMEIGESLKLSSGGRGADAQIGGAMINAAKDRKSFTDIRPMNISFNDIEGTSNLPKLLEEYNFAGVKFKDTRISGGNVDSFAIIPERLSSKTTTGGKTIVREASEKTPTILKKGSKVVDDFVPAAAKVEAPKTQELFRNPLEIARKWVDTREGFTRWRAADIKKTPALTQFDNDGINAIIDLQGGANPEKYKAVKDFTDGLFELEKKSGLLEPEQYRSSYLPQYWNNTPEEIQAVFSKTVGKKPSFTKARLLEDYKTGIEAGLKPRYDKVSDLLEARFSTSQKALADREFVDNLVTTGNAKTLDKAPPGWQAIDMTWESKTIAVPPEVASLVKNYTEEGSPLLRKTAEFVSEAKQTILSAGIPKTGWNFHTGVNIPVRRLAIGKNPFSGIVDSVIWNTKPSSAVNYIEKVVPKEITDGLLKSGLNISRSADDLGYGFKPRPGKGKIKQARTAWDRLFSEAAFDKVLPAHKLKIGWETYENALKKGASSSEAFRIAADTSNTMFGGINPQALGRSKDFQNVMRTFLLAPDWLESNVRIAKGTGGLLNPKNWSKAEYAPFKRFAVNAASMYGSFAMLNKAMSGHYPWENGRGQEFNLATGTFDERGRERVIPVFGTAFDFVRIPLQVIQGIASGDPQQVGRVLRNRFSPPVAAATSLFVTGEDYRGRPIDTPGEVVGQVAQAVGVPSQITNVVGGLTGEQTTEEVVAGLLEAPLRYKGGASTPEKRKTAELLKEGGTTNADINKAVSYKPKDDGGGFLSNIFGGKNSGANISIPKSKTEKKAFDKSVDQALEAGASDFTPEVLRERFFDGEKYDKSARTGQREILKEMLKVSDNEFLTAEQKASIANSAGIDETDLSYYKAASGDQTDRLEGLLVFANGEHEDRNQFMIDLVMGKRSVGGKSLFSTKMFERLFDDGLISKDERKLIKNIKYDPIFNKFYMDRDYTGDGGVSESKVRSFVRSINALHKNTFKSSRKTTAPSVAAPRAPTLNLPRLSNQRRTSDQWFSR